MGSCANIPYSYLIIEESGRTAYVVVEDWINYCANFRKTLVESQVVVEETQVVAKATPLLDHDYTVNKKICKPKDKRTREFDHDYYTSQKEEVPVDKKLGKSKRKLARGISSNTENDKRGGRSPRCPKCTELLPHLRTIPTKKTAYKCRSCGEVYLDKAKYEDHCKTNCSHTAETDVGPTILCSSVANIKSHNLEDIEKCNNISGPVSDGLNTTSCEAAISKFSAEDTSAPKVTKLAFKCKICSNVYLGETNFETHRIGCRKAAPKPRTVKKPEIPPKPVENVEFIVVGDTQKEYTVSLLPDKPKDLLHLATRSILVDYHNDACDIETYVSTTRDGETYDNTCDVSMYDNNTRNVDTYDSNACDIDTYDNTCDLDTYDSNTRESDGDNHSRPYTNSQSILKMKITEKAEESISQTFANTCGASKGTKSENMPKVVYTCKVCHRIFVGSHIFKMHSLRCKEENMDTDRSNKIGNAKIAEESIAHNFSVVCGANKGTKPKKATKVVYTCKVCDRIFVGANVFKMHSLRCKKGNVDTDTSNKIINTNITEESISQTFPDTCASKGTEPKNDTKAVHTCKICHRIFVGAYFKKHSLRCKEGNVDTDKCCDCGTVFELDVKKKRNRQTRGQGSRCPKCYSLYRQKKRREHTRRRHMVRPYPCDLCGKSFAERTRLKIHLLTHTDLRPFKCECCDYSARTKSVLKTHLERVHFAEGSERHPKPSYIRRRLHKEGLSETDVAIRLAADEEVHRCKQCRAAFAQETELEVHSNRHKTLELNEDGNSHKDRFLCDRCPKVFNKKFNFTMHYRLHTNERPYKCELCDKTFTGKMYLNSHKRTHTGEKQFKCQECNSAFLTKVALKYHFRKHTGEKRFQCTVCMSHFREAAGLVKHQSTVHDAGSEERPFKCYICGGGFLRKRNLVLHLHVHENITIDNQNTTIENW